MTLKHTIEQIFADNTNYLHAQQALNQANSLKSLSTDLYTDSTRFVYELVQNCDDSCDAQSNLRVAIVDHRYLVVCHDGKPFDDDDVRGLCDVGCSTKRSDEQKTGYKGLGFKAVFGQSDYVLIVSGGEFFRFEANAKAFKWNPKWGSSQAEWEAKHGRAVEFPWQICPIWTERHEVPELIRTWLMGQLKAVGTVVRLKDPASTTIAIGQLLEQPHVFMFLRNIKHVRFSFNSPQETLLSINQQRDSSVQLHYDSKPISHWLLCRCQAPVPAHARDDQRLPEKLRQASAIELTLAARIDKNNNIESLQGRHNPLFAYLPTRISTYNLPIAVNAQFSINASREHIHTDSPWNQFIFAQIPNEMIKWIGRLMQQHKWSEKALDLIPKPIPGQDALSKKYNDSCATADSRTPFLPNGRGQVLTVSQAVIDATGFSSDDCLGSVLVRNHVVRTQLARPDIAAHPFISNSKRLRGYRIPIFDWNHCVTMLSSPDFQMELRPDLAVRFLSYLFDRRSQPPIQAHLPTLPCLLDHQGILRTPNSVYLPSRSSHFSWSAAHDIDPYLHRDLVAWAETNRVALDWLKSLGVSEKTDEMFVRRKIIPNVERYTNRNNMIDTIGKLCDGFAAGRLPAVLLSQLNKLKLLSAANTFVAADQLYLSNTYSPRLLLQSFALDPGRFLSPIYAEQLLTTSPEHLKQLFLSLGVLEDIRPMRVKEQHHNELIAAYWSQQVQRLPPYSAPPFQSCVILPFLDATQTNYEFAVFFWQHVMHSVHVQQLNEKEIVISMQQQQFRVDNLLHWFVRTRACIPTTTKELLRSTDVVSSDLRSLAGDVLPVFVCPAINPLPPAWQYFFQFRTQLSLGEYMYLLNAFHERSMHSPIKDEHETCIQRLYRELMQCLVGLDRRTVDQYRPTASLHLLSTADNRFLPCTDLAASESKDLRLPAQVAQLKLSTDNARDLRLPQLLDFFNIRLVKLRDLTLSPNHNAELSLSLRAKLRDILPDLYKLAGDLKIDDDIEVYEVDRLELVYHGSIPVMQKDVHVVNNRVYVTRPWTSSKVIAILPQVLCQELKLPSTAESNVRQLLLSEQSDASRPPPVFHHSVDLLRIPSPRTKFAAVIDRDNEQLFRILKVTAETSPADLFSKAIDYPTSPYTGFVYHYTHLENAVSILREGLLRCRNDLSPNEFQDSAAAHIARDTRPEVNDYVRFYFRPLTPAQYCAENLGLSGSSHRYGNQPICPVPVLLRIDLEALLAVEDLDWKISLGNLAHPQTEFGNSIDVIKRFDFLDVYGHSPTERGRSSWLQEFLVNSRLNLRRLSSQDVTLIFQDANARDCLECMAGEQQYRTLVDDSFYYNTNPRVTIAFTDNDNEVTISLSKPAALTDGARLILQLSGDDRNRTVRGDLTASFQRGDVFTVYCKQSLSFTANLARVQYAVYYEFDNRAWLIHSNSSAPRFIAP